jgi:hypothetical protein
VVTVWARNQFTNTDRYAATVAPLATDPAIQNAIADQLTAQSFTRTEVGRIVQSPAFADAWVQANRLAHEELIKALTGESGGVITVENDAVGINLAAVIQTVKQQLVAARFTLAERIPQVNASFVLFQSKDITRRAPPSACSPPCCWPLAWRCSARSTWTRCRRSCSAWWWPPGRSSPASRSPRPAPARVWPVGLAGSSAAPTGPAYAPAPSGPGSHANRRALRIGAVALAGLALVLWSRPPVRSAHPNGMKTSTSAIPILAGWESLARRVHG